MVGSTHIKAEEQNHISVNKRYLKQTHKFGIRLPKSVKEAYEIDRQTNTTYWSYVIKKEMKTVDVAFEVLEDDENLPVGYQYMECHMVFDIKMGSLQRKARMVGGGHMTDLPSVHTFASIVSQDSV